MKQRSTRAKRALLLAALSKTVICSLMLAVLLFGIPIIQGLSYRDSQGLAGVGASQKAYAATWYGSGWQQSGSKWWYADGYSYYTGWHAIGGHWYYFNSAGWMVTGWLASNNHWYYLYELSAFGSSWEGKMAKYGWEVIGGSYFYFRTADNNIAPGDEGAILESGYWYISDGYYWFNDNGNYTKKALSLGLTSSTETRDSLASNYQKYSQGTRYANCLSFALDKVPWYNDQRDWTWVWGTRNPTITECKTWLKNHTQYDTFTSSAPSQKPFIIAYGKNGLVTHFARVNTSGGIHAKWGNCEIFTHTTTSPYKSTGAYGSRLFYAY